MPIAQNYRIPVYVGDIEHQAVFYRTTNDQFDLRYGWELTSCMHSSLEDVKEDFLNGLKKRYPNQTISLGSEHQITEEQARTFAPSFLPLRPSV